MAPAATRRHASEHWWAPLYGLSDDEASHILSGRGLGADVIRPVLKQELADADTDAAPNIASFQLVASAANIYIEEGASVVANGNYFLPSVASPRYASIFPEPGASHTGHRACAMGGAHAGSGGSKLCDPLYSLFNEKMFYGSIRLPRSAGAPGDAAPTSPGVPVAADGAGQRIGGEPGGRIQLTAQSDDGGAISIAGTLSASGLSDDCDAESSPSSCGGSGSGGSILLTARAVTVSDAGQVLARGGASVGDGGGGSGGRISFDADSASGWERAGAGGGAGMYPGAPGTIYVSPTNTLVVNGEVAVNASALLLPDPPAEPSQPVRKMDDPLMLQRSVGAFLSNAVAPFTHVYVTGGNLYLFDAVVVQGVASYFIHDLALFNAVLYEPAATGASYLSVYAHAFSAVSSFVLSSIYDVAFGATSADTDAAFSFRDSVFFSLPYTDFTDEPGASYYFESFGNLLFELNGTFAASHCEFSFFYTECSAASVLFADTFVSAWTNVGITSSGNVTFLNTNFFSSGCTIQAGDLYVDAASRFYSDTRGEASDDGYARGDMYTCSGASHAGKGARSCGLNGKGNKPNHKFSDNARYPTDSAGGGGYDMGWGGEGGGVFWFIADSFMRFDGLVNATGVAGSCSSHYKICGGGGCGGSVFLQAPTFEGRGRFVLDGGDAADPDPIDASQDYGGWDIIGGAGAGGRLSLLVPGGVKLRYSLEAGKAPSYCPSHTAGEGGLYVENYGASHALNNRQLGCLIAILECVVFVIVFILVHTGAAPCLRLGRAAASAGEEIENELEVHEHMIVQKDTCSRVEAAAELKPLFVSGKLPETTPALPHFPLNNPPLLAATLRTLRRFHVPAQLVCAALCAPALAISAAYTDLLFVPIAYAVLLVYVAALLCVTAFTSELALRALANTAPLFIAPLTAASLTTCFIPFAAGPDSVESLLVLILGPLALLVLLSYGLSSHTVSVSALREVAVVTTVVLRVPFFSDFFNAASGAFAVRERWVPFRAFAAPPGK